MTIVIERGACPLRGLSLPDYAQPKPVGTVPVGPIYTSADVAELAARLGSPVTFDRRGNVIWFDDFEDGVNMWIPSTDVRWLTSRSQSKGFCMGLYSGDWHWWTSHYMHYPTVSRLGWEVSIDLPLNCIFVTWLRVDNGTTEYTAAVKYNYKTHEISIATSYHGFPLAELVYEVISPPLLYQSLGFETFKIVGNFSTGYYERLIIDKEIYKITGYPLAPYKTVSGNPILSCYIGAEHVDGFGNILSMGCVDNVIVTQQEPPNPVE